MDGGGCGRYWSLSEVLDRFVPVFQYNVLLMWTSINVILHIPAVWTHWLLTHWDKILAPGNRDIIGSVNGLAPVWRQAINWTNGVLLSIGHQFSEIWIAIIFVEIDAYENVVCQMTVILFRPQCINNVGKPGALSHSTIYVICSVNDNVSGHQ